jgi:hypothetical protein
VIIMKGSWCNVNPGFAGKESGEGNPIWIKI